MVSSSFLSLVQQQEEITASYTYSVFGIAWLNETLPPYMSRDYALAPFQPQDVRDTGSSEQWRAATTRYGVNVTCEPAQVTSITTHQADSGPVESSYYIGSNGCQVPLPFGPTGNETLGGSGVGETKEFTGLYAGYNDQDGYADYYLSVYCPVNASHTFLASIARNKKQEKDPPNVPTIIFCTPEYYAQKVYATVARNKLAVISAIPVEDARPVPKEMFNSTNLDWQMNSAMQSALIRGEVPASRWPDQRERLSSLDISLHVNGAELPIMVGMAIGADPRPLEEYLDHALLGASYEAAYRLLFARAMTDILASNWSHYELVPGQRQYQTETIVVVPVFAYLVEGLLGLVGSLTLGLIILTVRKKHKLVTDPAPITAMMSLVASSRHLLLPFRELDQASAARVDQALKGRKYRLKQTRNGSHLLDISDEAGVTVKQERLSGSTPIMSLHGIRPLEFRLPVAFTFISLQVSLIVGLAYLFVKAGNNGISLPSSNRFVRQLVENYMPTIIATFLEPVWVGLNRLLCMLQPLEELRSCKALTEKSVGLNYSSLPPQLVFWKALRAGHVMTAAVCAMALLANLLAITFSGLFNEGVAVVYHDAFFAQPYTAFFGKHTIGPDYNTFKLDGRYKGIGLDQYYTAMSNLTSGTPMPEWTDDKFFYLPSALPTPIDNSHQYQVATRAFGLEMTCQPLEPNPRNSMDPSLGSNWYNIASDPIDKTKVVTDVKGGNPITCLLHVNLPNMTSLAQSQCQSERLAAESMLQEVPMIAKTSTDPCNQIFVSSWLRYPGQNICGPESSPQFKDLDVTLIACALDIVTRTANVTVDASSHVLYSSVHEDESTSFGDFFKGHPLELIAPAISYLGYPTITGGQPAWHNDTFSSDFQNYFMQLEGGSDRLLDPKLPAPSFDDVGPLSARIVSKVFAIWLGINAHDLLVPSSRPLPLVQGRIAMQETRIFMSTPMFIISETILSLYVGVSILLHLHRPGRFLPRLPTTIASVIVMFAASYALQDLQNTGTLSAKERARHLEDLDRRYGYGKFVGVDGKSHTGIERQPLVMPLKSAEIVGSGRKRTWHGTKRTGR
ncbi:hypothetical protein LTR50_005799 [Elasticomyces elasticus]|nr:hypothetical protein LTR50_005799 [Elasticomyces elasticus]